MKYKVIYRIGFSSNCMKIFNSLEEANQFIQKNASKYWTDYKLIKQG